MNCLLNIFILLFSSIWLHACYTTLKYQRVDMEANPPDLAIVSVEHLWDYTSIGMRTNIPDKDLPRARFIVRITNVAKGSFYGWILIQWADNIVDIQSGKYSYNHFTSIPSSEIYPADTINIGFTIGQRFYPSGTKLKFHILGIKKDRSDLSLVNNSNYTEIKELTTNNNYYEFTTIQGAAVLNGKIIR